MSDFQDTELLPPAPSPEELKRQIRRQRISWAAYVLAAAAAVVVALSASGFWF